MYSFTTQDFGQVPGALVTKKEKIGHVRLERFTPPQQVEFEGVVFDLKVTEQMPLSGTKVTYMSSVNNTILKFW